MLIFFLNAHKNNVESISSNIKIMSTKKIGILAKFFLACDESHFVLKKFHDHQFMTCNNIFNQLLTIGIYPKNLLIHFIIF
jgi:hypothetical protein